jgi:hypothetical protein
MEEIAGIDGVDFSIVSGAFDGTVKAADSDELILSNDWTFDTAVTCVIVSAFAELDIHEDNPERYEDDDDGAGVGPPDTAIADEA